MDETSETKLEEHVSSEPVANTGNRERIGRSPLLREVGDVSVRAFRNEVVCKDAQLLFRHVGYRANEHVPHDFFSCFTH